MFGVLKQVPHNYQKSDYETPEHPISDCSQQCMSSLMWAFLTQFGVKAEHPDLNPQCSSGTQLQFQTFDRQTMHNFGKALTIF